MWEEDAICRISTPPLFVVEIKLDTSCDAVVDWNCMRSMEEDDDVVLGFAVTVGMADGLGVGVAVGECCTTTASLFWYCTEEA